MLGRARRFDPAKEADEQQQDRQQTGTRDPHGGLRVPPDVSQPAKAAPRAVPPKAKKLYTAPTRPWYSASTLSCRIAIECTL
ncbi:hypothetical protein Shyd_56820 [Streptomyces hydrogenans]|uniref:Uncharacterized protein n=1 Tax=Streptomyces hydrogenans TaxID=1873719 RepID=A0ABQ3PH22_9ACTN|nr:hypothetical protein Shyd_56820 [Streptomyces hydrogenans]